MANPFYTPSGNPAAGSEGLSLLIRAEFQAISLAFDMVPAITTTGLFSTVFNQVGSYTFTLPSAPGTLAMLSDVATETTRATAAEAANATAITTETTARGTAITTEVTNRNTAIAVETTRAQAAETTNATAITTERTRALLAEGAALGGALTGTLPNPGLAATGVAAGTTTLVPDFITPSTITIGADGRVSGIVGLPYHVVQEGTGPRQNPAHSVSLGWTATSTVAIAIDGADQGDIAVQTWVTAAITTETTRATAAEGANATAITTEVTNRNTAIAVETTRAQAAEGVNATAISAETSRAGGAEGVNATAIGAEATRASNAEASIRANYLPLSGGTVAGGLAVDLVFTAAGGILSLLAVPTGATSGWQLNATGTAAFTGGVNVGINNSGLDVLSNRFIAASDGRVKSDMRCMTTTEADRFVDRVHGRWYRKMDQWEGGFPAQEILAEGFPEMIIMAEQDGMPAEANGFSGPVDFQMYLKDGAVPLIATSLRAARRRILTLEHRLAVLEARLQ